MIDRRVGGDKVIGVRRAEHVGRDEVHRHLDALSDLEGEGPQVRAADGAGGGAGEGQVGAGQPEVVRHEHRAGSHRHRAGGRVRGAGPKIGCERRERPPAHLGQ